MVCDLLIKNIGMLATPLGDCAKKGKSQNDITILKDAAIGIKDNDICFVGKQQDAPQADAVLDAGHRLVTPGLIDAHTHLVFGGWRQNEFGLKLEGASYLDILRAGGGILSSVTSTREASEDALYTKAEKVLDEMLSFGVTTVEAKSGYGLTVQDELKQLQVVQDLMQDHPMDIISTFMGAHATPPEYQEDKASYIDLICDEMIPAVAEKNLAKYCDVFCETDVFTAKETEKILNIAKEYGMGMKLHADEIDNIGGSELAGEIGAISAEHLIVAKDAGIRSMANGNVIGVLLPSTSFYLGATYAPARKMLAQNMALAIATDFNPGSSPNSNLQIAMNIACLKLSMTPAEVLTAVTLNAAASIEMAHRVGSIEVGKQADIVVWDAPDLNYIFYRMGSNLAETVIKDGIII